jgi:hypothetical protein
MATRLHRLAQFVTDRAPPPGQRCRVLCEDHVGTYEPRFLCEFRDGAWFNCDTGERMEAAVLGWREPAPKIS